MLVILTIGGLASGMLYAQEHAAAADREAEAVGRIASTLSTTGDVLIAGLSGATGIVDPSGAVERPVFEAYAANVAATTALATVAYEPIVRRSDRVAFEQQLGGSILQPGANGLETAAQRDTYLPVQWTHPTTGDSGRIIGFDIASDHVRGEAAAASRDTGQVVFSQPVTTQPAGNVAFFLIRPLYIPGLPLDTIDQRRAAVVGYVSSAVPATVLFDGLVGQLPRDGKLSITDDGDLLAATAAVPQGGHTAEVVRGGRVWTLRLDDRHTDQRAALVMLLSTIGVAALAGGFLLRNRRQTLELRSAAVSVRLLGQLSEHLAVADTRDDVLRTIGTQAARTAGGSVATVSLPVAARSELLTAATPESSTTGFPSVVPIDGSSLIADAFRGNELVHVDGIGEMRRRYPAHAERFERAGWQAAAAMPLRSASGESMAVLLVVWPRPRTLGNRLRSTLEAVAEVSRQSLLRADGQELRRSLAAALSDLGQRLSVARTLDDVAREVVTLGPAASGADAVGIAFINEAATAMHIVRAGTASGLDQYADIAIDPAAPMVELLRRGERVHLDSPEAIDRYPALRQLVGRRIEQLVVMPLIDSTGRLRGALGFVFRPSDRDREPLEIGRFVTIADLSAQTIERSVLYHHQHELVVQLQRRTLPELPVVEGLRVAARYLPASSVLGMGGDWYDVQVLADGRCGIVVGDVVGHGIEAIADMTEIRTTVSTLLRTDPDLAMVPTVATELLATGGDDDVLFATALLMIATPFGGELLYVRAGHPPALLRTPDGEVVVLEGGGATPIGVRGPAADVERLPFVSGTVVVAYSDGLVERRGEHFDTGLERLSAAFAAARTDDVERLADLLVEACLGGRDTEDDAAMLVFACP